MDISTIVGHLAFGLIAFSYLVKDIMYLRVLSIVASSFGMFFNYTVPAEPMWLPIGWNALFVFVNLYHIHRPRSESGHTEPFAPERPGHRPVMFVLVQRLLHYWHTILMKS